MSNSNTRNARNRRWRRLQKRNTDSICNDHVGLNGKYVARKCAEYVVRYLNNDGHIGSNCMELVCWLLGSRMHGVAERALPLVDKKKEYLRDSSLYDHFEDELAEAGSDHNEISGVLVDIVQSFRNRASCQFRKILTTELELVGKDCHEKCKSSIEKILDEFQAMFRLTPKEVDVCAFLLVMSTYDKAESFFVNHLELNKFSSRQYLLKVLDLSEQEYVEIFSGTIKTIGLLEMDNVDLRIERDFLEFFLLPGGQMSNKFFTTLGRNLTPLAHHFVESGDVDHIVNLLRRCNSSPTHILLYGQPGTGKSSFAKGLAEQLDFAAYQITQGEEDNDSRARRTAIMACLNMTSNGKDSLVVVDEADNILNTGFSWLLRGETQDKGWLNNLLEKPGAKMIWITNSIDDIDESVMRRFAFSIHFKQFSRKQRQILWENLIRKRQVKRFFTNGDISDLAGRYQVTAGAVDMALQKAKEAGAGTRKDFIAAVTRSIDSYETLKNGGVKKSRPIVTERAFSLDGLNVNACLPDIMEQLGHFDKYLRTDNHGTNYSMNLLFHGPPGTGKSELARNIAFHFDRELMIKGLSDILDPYVGMTERNIKTAFDEAEAEEAVLVFDEVDSFLYSRTKAVRSWESSQTNEFLTCMEKYKGVLICTTNMLDGLDSASLRRFNHKVGFEFLTPEGSVAFYEKFFGKLVRGVPDKNNEKKLRAIENLAPGDFKVVRDRCAFRSPENLDHGLLIRELAGEAEIKGVSKKAAIGF